MMADEQQCVTLREKQSTRLHCGKILNLHLTVISVLVI